MFSFDGENSLRQGLLDDPHTHAGDHDVRLVIDPVVPTSGAPIRVCHFDATGRRTFQTLTRADILGLIHSTSDDFVGTSHVVSSIDPSNEKRKLGHSIHMRDIRQLDQAYAESTDASLVIRQHAILVNVDPIRAVILRNQFIVLLGTTNTVDSLMDQLQQRVQAYLRESPGTAFEFTALEGLLSTITSWLAMKCAGLKPTVETSLASFARAERPRDEFEQVRNVQTAVTTLHVQVSGIRGMLMTLLDDEADLCMMHLTKLAQSLDQQVVDLDEVESVLETNLQDVFGTLASISMLLSKIDNTQRMVDLAWTSKRNYLLVVDMSLKFMFLGVLVTHLWTGMFGQNLESHVKEDGMWFAATFGGCSIWIVGFYVVVYVYFKSKNIALSWRKPGFVAPED